MNFSPGKTEGVTFINGTGAIKEQRFLAVVGHKIGCPTRLGRRQLRIAPTYKRLGTKIVSSAEILPEIKTRSAQMREAAVPLRKKVIERHEVDPCKRASIVTAHLLTKGAFQTSAWPELRPKELVVFHTSVISMLRPIAVTAYGPPPKHKAGERWPLERVVSDGSANHSGHCPCRHASLDLTNIAGALVPKTTGHCNANAVRSQGGEAIMAASG